MTKEELIENIILNENAYFFKKIENSFLSKKIIEDTFVEASANKSGNFLLKTVKKRKIIDGETSYLSLCVFKYNKKPTFIKEEVAKWNETKLAYICIVDFKHYISISKRNISGIKNLYKKLLPIDYKILTSIFITDKTLFEKFSMNNMNISDKSIRAKSVEANDLKENLSTLGLQSYVLSNLRINNDNDKISLTLNSSRINKFGNKNNIDFFIKWSKIIIEKIKNYRQKDSFISTFATPLNFEDERTSLIPISILIILTDLYSAFEDNLIETCDLVIGDKSRKIDLIKATDNFKRLLNIEKKDKDDKTIYKIINPIANDLTLSINSKTITLRSKKLNNIIIKFTDETEISVIDYLNRTSSFIVTFDTPDLIYSNRKLFRDNRLLGNTDAFLSIFEPFNELDDIVSEKGTFTTSSDSFSEKSIFNFVESQFLLKSKYFICDDLGNEWADHIGLFDNNISFYHSKYKNSNFSASAFQDVIGQAQKNLGNLSPADNLWPMKLNKWQKKYKSSNGIQTNISRIRKGDNANDAIEYYKELKTFPNLSKSVYIIVNFISKKDLADRLDKLKNGEDFAERNEIIQILWFISSLISSCYEVGANIHILCKD